jgi:hypothetical protein
MRLTARSQAESSTRLKDKNTPMKKAEDTSTEKAGVVENGNPWHFWEVRFGFKSSHPNTPVNFSARLYTIFALDNKINT